MSELTRLTDVEATQLRNAFPRLPPDYLTLMCKVGWGEQPSGHVIYSWPIWPNEVYPLLAPDRRQVLIGDDMQGNCLGYDFAAKCYGEFSDTGDWNPFDDDFTLTRYLSDAT